MYYALGRPYVGEENYALFPYQDRYSYVNIQTIAVRRRSLTFDLVSGCINVGTQFIIM